MRSRERENGIHLTGDARVMHRHDRPGPLGKRAFDQSLVKIERVLADVDEDRLGAAQDEGVGRRNKGPGGHDDFVGRTGIEEKGRHLESGGAGMGQQSRHAEPLAQEGMTFAREGTVTPDVALLETGAQVLESLGIDARSGKLHERTRPVRLAVMES